MSQCRIEYVHLAACGATVVLLTTESMYDSKLMSKLEPNE